MKCLAVQQLLWFFVVFIVHWTRLESVTCSLYCESEAADPGTKLNDVIKSSDKRHVISHVVLLIPFTKIPELNCRRLTPALALAEERLQQLGVTESVHLCFHLADSKCNPKTGALTAFSFYRRQMVHVFLGPFCDYCLSPVAKYAPFWSIPILTAGGHSHTFQNKTKIFSTLTRIWGSYDALSKSFLRYLTDLGYSRFALLYDKHKVAPYNSELLSSAFVENAKGKFTVTHQFMDVTRNLSKVFIKEIGVLFSGCGSKRNTSTVSQGNTSSVSTGQIYATYGADYDLTSVFSPSSTATGAVLKIFVLIFAPDHDDSLLIGRKKIQPALALAVGRVRDRSLLDSADLEFHFADTQCDEIHAPLAAFDYRMKNQVHCFIGPFCDYSLSPVALYAPDWELPVITHGGLHFEFRNDKEFTTLTRVGITTEKLTTFVATLMYRFNWTTFKIIEDPNYHHHICNSALSYFKVMANKSNLTFKGFFLKEKGNHEKMLIEEVGTSYSGK
ncbi:hypothetical protein Btru_070460 [Bulinus truncatus]|nr:hypothetical protein Btru_070460 [Bulinus truncatus]